MTTLDNVHAFAEFARARLASGEEASIDELFADWREHANRTNDAAAIQASVRDVENGARGRPLEEFFAEFDAECANGDK